MYRDEGKYNLIIQRCLEGLRREDPPAIPQLAVPVTVANEAFQIGEKTLNVRLTATGELVLIAFYFLLRVGEYTKPKLVYKNKKKVRATRTVQFSVGNIGFYKDGKLVPRTSSQSVLESCDSATLKITNQKNGRMGQTIHQKATDGPNNPIVALARRVHHILSNGGTTDSLLCDYFYKGKWHSVESAHIVKLVRYTVKKLGLHTSGIDPDLVGAHSLRAGGAMALRLHGFSDTVIMKMGRWTSLTFLQYIHNQIAHLSEDVSKKMSIPLPFLNIASVAE